MVETNMKEETLTYHSESHFSGAGSTHWQQWVVDVRVGGEMLRIPYDILIPADESDDGQEEAVVDVLESLG